MRTPRSPVEPCVRHTPAVEAPHRIHVEECGNPSGIPVLFVHGRHGVVGPVDQARALRRAWPGPEPEVIPGAGRPASEPALADVPVRATDRFAERPG